MLTTATQPGPSYALLVQNSGTTYANGPVIRHNVILSGDVNTASSTTAGVRLENSVLQLRNNFIKSGTIVNGIANFLSLAAGLLVVNSNPLVVNNVIVADSITSGSEAWSIGTYHFSATGGTYTNNTVATLATNGNIYAMAINGGTGKPVLTNNIFYQTNGYSWLLWEWNTGDNPVSLHNNAFIGGTFAYRDMPANANRNSQADLQSATLTNQSADSNTVSANIRIAGACIPFKNIAEDNWQFKTALDPGYADCTATHWNDLKYGGRNTSNATCGTGSASCGSVTDDLSAASRTTSTGGASFLALSEGYSIGAYEQD